MTPLKGLSELETVLESTIKKYNSINSGRPPSTGHIQFQTRETIVLTVWNNQKNSCSSTIAAIIHSQTKVLCYYILRHPRNLRGDEKCSLNRGFDLRRIDLKWHSSLISVDCRFDKNHYHKCCHDRMTLIRINCYDQQNDPRHSRARLK